MNEFLQRLKQRKLVQWVVAYVAAAFALLQGIDIIASRFGWPDAIERILIIVSCIGFFVVLVLAWYHGERGAQRVTGAELLILGLVLLVGGGFIWRFAASSREVATPSTRVPNENEISAPPATVVEKSIAVLPFENLSDDKQNAYFADGIQDEILTRLAKIAQLKVISRTSTKRFKSASGNVREIAQQLGVIHLLEGSVQKSNNQVRVNVQLINARNDSHVWAETYDRKLDDIFAVEGEIATKVADTLQAKLTGSAKLLLASRPTENSEAHQTYLRGKYYHARGTEADYRQSIDYYKSAIKLDGNYAEAYTALATAWINLARKFLSGSEAQQAYEQARIATDTALALAPNLADAHATRGLLLESTDFDWKEEPARRTNVRMREQGFGCGNER